MAPKYELVIYAGGTAILTDEEDATVWASDADEDFAQEFPEILTYEDGDAIMEYLFDADYLPEDSRVHIVQSDDTGLHEVISDDYDPDEDEDDEDEDEFEDEDA